MNMDKQKLFLSKKIPPKIFFPIKNRIFWPQNILINILDLFQIGKVQKSFWFYTNRSPK